MGEQPEKDTDKTTDDLPEFSSPLLEAAGALHELYIGLVGQGFTERQALYMLGVMLATGNGDSPD